MSKKSKTLNNDKKGDYMKLIKNSNYNRVYGIK